MVTKLYELKNKMFWRIFPQRQGTCSHWEEVMKRVKELTPLILAVVLSIYCAKAAIGNDVKPQFQERVKLSEQNGRLEKAYAFCVTDDDLFMIPDYDAGNVKIYVRKGAFLVVTKTIGQKGYGKNRFIKPKFSSINDSEGKFLVMDYGLRKIFVYERNVGTEFNRILEINCPNLGYDMQLTGDRLLISGYYPNKKGNPYDMYSIKLGTDVVNYLLPSYKKYGLKSEEEYITEYREKHDIPSIGVKGWFAIQGDTIYFSWQGNLKILKSNFQTPKWHEFGEKKSPYTQPFASDILKFQAMRKDRPGDQDAIDEEKEKMSYVTGLFTNAENLILIYNGPGKSNFRLQYYTLEGEFLKEVAIPKKPDKRMWFNKKTNTLYSLTGGNDSDYYILKYKIPIVKKQI